MNLYLTADQVGLSNHGGGSVTYQESQALQELGPTEVWDRGVLEDKIKLVTRGGYGTFSDEPWLWDDAALSKTLYQEVINCSGFVPEKLANIGSFPGLVHLYAGTFSQTVERLKSKGCRISYTAAAHDIDVSRREHERLGLPFQYPHLTDPELWRRYVAGYLAADVVVCPSQHSTHCMQKYGCSRVEVIPHGVLLPKWDAPNSISTFRVGYLGSAGSPDKGVVYLLQAWKQLAYPDAILVLAGRDSTSPWVRHLIKQYGGGNIVCLGWVNDIADFYNQISVYCQPSCTEGFALEVLEALSFGRTVICSKGAGACDVVPEGWRFESCNVEHLISQIEDAKRLHKQGNLPRLEDQRAIAEQYSWDKVKIRYQQVWRNLL